MSTERPEDVASCTPPEPDDPARNGSPRPPNAIALLKLDQAGKCAVCETTTPGTKGWCLDHCHRTGKVRGMLCGPCNLALGLMRDNPERLRKAAAYLESGGPAKPYAWNWHDRGEDGRSNAVKADRRSTRRRVKPPRAFNAETAAIWGSPPETAPKVATRAIPKTTPRTRPASAPSTDRLAAVLAWPNPGEGAP